MICVSLALGCNRGPREVRRDVEIVHGQLDKREIYVPVNTQVAITLRNRDKSPTAPARRCVLVQPGRVPGPAQTPKPADVLSQSPPVSPGRSATFRFPAPESGNYEFFCSSAGEGSAQGGAPPTVLRGKFVVQ